MVCFLSHFPISLPLPFTYAHHLLQYHTSAISLYFLLLLFFITLDGYWVPLNYKYPGALLSSGTSDEEIRHSDGTSSKVFLSITLPPISLINVTNAGYFDQIGISWSKHPTFFLWSPVYNWLLACLGGTEENIICLSYTPSNLSTPKGSFPCTRSFHVTVK